ncbi:hypothetical protein Cgig2_007171 [Carnegiea gigantea]|uniref:Uncharacterized protein n=1 Tax=Carnegiea gigantea TaxID=171969 RepID=A0A9Q1Q5J1_9CARY|nr:hypothetical protein Cgig2_007171 [Carnegiea gigantea]
MASLLVQRYKSIRILTSIWWVSCFLLVSPRNISMLLTNQDIPILDNLSFMNSLLLFCALEKSQTSLSEPLLHEEPKETNKKPSTFSQLTFSWINPLFCVDYSRPSVLGDIPNLFSEDEANIFYQKFMAPVQHPHRDTCLDYCNGNSSFPSTPLCVCELLKQKRGESREGTILVVRTILVKVARSLSQRHCHF